MQNLVKAPLKGVEEKRDFSLLLNASFDGPFQ
jgi:hypothetical protein